MEVVLVACMMAVVAQQLVECELDIVDSLSIFLGYCQHFEAENLIIEVYSFPEVASLRLHCWDES
jgi:hypothetical protein